MGTSVWTDSQAGPAFVRYPITLGSLLPEILKTPAWLMLFFLYDSGVSELSPPLIFITFIISMRFGEVTVSSNYYLEIKPAWLPIRLSLM